MTDEEIKKLSDLIIEKMSELFDAENNSKKMTLTTEEVAHELSCSTKYVSKLRMQKKIKGIKRGNKYVYPRTSIEQYVKNCGITKKGA